MSRSISSYLFDNDLSSSTPGASILAHSLKGFRACSFVESLSCRRFVPMACPQDRATGPFFKLVLTSSITSFPTEEPNGVGPPFPRRSYDSMNTPAQEQRCYHLAAPLGFKLRMSGNSCANSICTFCYFATKLLWRRPTNQTRMALEVLLLLSFACAVEAILFASREMHPGTCQIAPVHPPPNHRFEVEA